ncbi:MAG: hypothetical protein WAK29_09560 [Terriglobales bacterium]
MKHDIEKGTVHLQSISVIGDEAQVSKPVQEKSSRGTAKLLNGFTAPRNFHANNVTVGVHYEF